MHILVLGVGSILMGDDGVGVRAVEEIKRRYYVPENLEILDGGTSGLDLLPFIAGKDYLIIIDAIKSGSPPGTVLMAQGDDVPARFRMRISPHQLGISELLATATLTDELPKNIVLFGIEPKTIQLGISLSHEVKAGMDKLIKTVVNYLDSIGCRLETRPASEIKEEYSFWGEM